jgi:transcriptional regulator of heat shock response
MTWRARGAWIPDASPHFGRRVPTEKGYRYFVESLMEELELPLTEQRMISHQFHQVTLDVEQWMRLTAAVVAHSAQRRARNGAAVHTLPL